MGTRDQERQADMLEEVHRRTWQALKRFESPGNLKVMELACDEIVEAVDEIWTAAIKKAVGAAMHGRLA